MQDQNHSPHLAYGPYFLGSAVLHLLLLFVLIINISFDPVKKIKLISLDNNSEIKNKAVEPELIKAFLVEPVDSKKIKQLEKLAKEQELQKQLDLERVAVIKQEKLKQEKIKQEKLKQEEFIKAAQIKKQLELDKQLAIEKLIKQEQIKKQLEFDKQFAKDEKIKKQAAAEDKAEKLKKAEQLKKKKQEELLAKLKQDLKKEQEQKLQNDLLSEEQMINQSQQRVAVKQREIEKYIGMQQAKVSRNWNSRDNFIGKNLVTKLEINLARDGRVISARVIKSSGNPALDVSAKNAVYKASPLPVPEDDELFKTFMSYNFTFRPDELS